jgi:hypothetical protein
VVLRKAVVVAAGLAMMASVGLAGAGAVSAASPAVLHIKPGSPWTLQINNGGNCEIETFQSDTFTSDLHGDSGTWSGGASTVSMVWTAGIRVGEKFHGSYNSSHREYSGSGTTRQLVKGAVPFWNGFTC